MPTIAGGGSISVLGPLQVTVDGRVVALRPAQRRLLAILLVEPGTPVARDVLLDRMWGESLPATAPSALQVHMSGIRKAAPRLLMTTSAGYAVEMAAYSLDRLAFEEAAARATSEARRNEWGGVLRAATRALTSWRGQPYHELGDDEFASATIARLTAVHDELTELRAQALLEAAHVDEAIVELRALVQAHPLREPLWERLMIALHRAGRSAEALRAFQEARAILAAELGVEPAAALRRTEEQIVQGGGTLGEAALAPAETTLPLMLTSFVGREDDVHGVVDLLAAERLVTIVGGPGLGKTRLAVEIGHAVLPAHPDGAWFVRLAAARNEQDVVGAVAAAVGLRSQTASLAELAARLAGRDGVLILDNCEHLVEPVAALVGLVIARPGRVRILATSRRPVGLDAEVIWRLAPLPPPLPGDEPLDERSVLGSPAVRLFLDRARAADRSYRLTAASAPLVAALCRRADGIPLALELAAAWVPGLGLTDIEEMLASEQAPRSAERNLPAQHRSLVAAIEWSIALLGPEDRALFSAVSIFRGTFGLEDVLGVCAGGLERRRTAAAIGRLVDASLVVADRRDDGLVSYRTLVPIRELARERLEHQEGWEAIRDRFVTHYLGKARGSGSDPFRAVVDLRQVDDAIDNMREAFELAIDTGRAPEAAAAIVALDGYFMNRYLAREQRAWLSQLLPLLSDATSRAPALLSAALAAQATNDLDEAVILLRQAADAFEGLDDAKGTARCLLALAGLSANRGAWAGGAAAAREGRALIDVTDNASGAAIAAYYLGTNLAYGGDVADGLTELAESARLFEEAGELGRASQALSTMTYLAVLANDEPLARSTAERALALGWRSESQVRQVRALSASAALEAAWGSARLAGSRFRDVDATLRAQANEDLFELLLPAGFLLRRRKEWRLLADLVAAVEAALDHSSQGYPEPWRNRADLWRREAVARMTANAAGDRADIDRPADVHDVRQRLRAMLAADGEPVDGRAG